MFSIQVVFQAQGNYTASLLSWYDKGSILYKKHLFKLQFFNICSFTQKVLCELFKSKNNDEDKRARKLSCAISVFAETNNSVSYVMM